MVSKRPTVAPVREVEVQVGSHDRRQAAFDFGGALDADGVPSYRLVGLRREADISYDHVSEKKTFIAPSLTFRPSDATQITVLGHWQSLDSPGGGGAPALPPARWTPAATPRCRPVPSSASRASTATRTASAYIGYEAEHPVNDSVVLRQNLRYGKVTAETRRIQAFCLSTCNPAALSRYAWTFPEQADLLTVDTQAQMDFRAGPLAHTVLTGRYDRAETATRTLTATTGRTLGPGAPATLAQRRAAGAQHRQPGQQALRGVVPGIRGLLLRRAPQRVPDGTLWLVTRTGATSCPVPEAGTGGRVCVDSSPGAIHVLTTARNGNTPAAFPSPMIRPGRALCPAITLELIRQDREGEKPWHILDPWGGPLHWPPVCSPAAARRGATPSATGRWWTTPARPCSCAA
ncbi:hypothetical protein [Paracidovorax cattleyae]|uniref:hypothetical protein n=1 Tax=Paracidovorax cattleyae TaxID=80868 RepID=UPI001FC9B50C|nr:hypothetical protein [Paracidovorax cattleyae]